LKEMVTIDSDIMWAIAPRFSGAAAARQAQIITEVGPALQDVLKRYELDTRLRAAHFLAQTCHESAGFRTTEEFASGQQYEGRQDLGNTQRGDGRRYKGRGLLQLTGRANYRAYGQALGIDLEGDPERAGDPVLSLEIACEYWKRRTINPDCDRDDLVAVTRKVNGGLNGLDSRREYLGRAKIALARVDAIHMAGGHPDSRPVLRRGSTGDAVGHLQELLRKVGFPIAIDQSFGPATELAVVQFQRKTKLESDGIVGPVTWDALENAAK
jgi:putative chitinase